MGERMMELRDYIRILTNARKHMKNCEHYITVQRALWGQYNDEEFSHAIDEVYEWIESILYPYEYISDYLYGERQLILNDKQLRKYQIKWLKKLIKQCQDWDDFDKDKWA